MPKFKKIKDDGINPGSQQIFETGRDARGPATPKKYLNRLRWDEKAKMYTVVDIPKDQLKSN